MADEWLGASGFFDLASDLMAVASRTSLSWQRINPAFEHVLGWHGDDLLREPVHRLVHADDHAALDRAVEEVGAGGTAAVDLHLLKAGGGYEATRWRLAASDPDLLLCVGRRIPEDREKRLNERISELTHEIEHRVRNNLAVIRAIIRRTAETEDDEQSFAHLQGRIDAFARVQAKLKLAGGDDQAVDLALLVEDELLAQSMREGEALTIEGPNVALAPRAAEAIGLAIHELAMNAIKFGAFCVRGARVEVRWRIAGDEGARLLLLTWWEFGVDLDPGEKRDEGFGMETLLRSLPYELAAETEVDLTSDGIRFAMSVPLDRIGARPRPA